MAFTTHNRARAETGLSTLATWWLILISWDVYKSFRKRGLYESKATGRELQEENMGRVQTEPSGSFSIFVHLFKAQWEWTIQTEMHGMISGTWHQWWSQRLLSQMLLSLGWFLYILTQRSFCSETKVQITPPASNLKAAWKVSCYRPRLSVTAHNKDDSKSPRSFRNMLVLVRSMRSRDNGRLSWS